MYDVPRIPGHALRREGKPYGKVPGPKGMEHWPETGPLGYALCECGATSEMLDSDRARKDWHRMIHKRGIILEREKADSESKPDR